MKREYTRKDRTKKIFIEYFTINDSGKISLQSRKFNDINKAYYFVDTLPQRGVLEGNIKIIIDFSFEPDTKDIEPEIQKLINAGEKKHLQTLSLKFLSTKT